MMGKKGDCGSNGRKGKIDILIHRKISTITKNIHIKDHRVYLEL
jgi:hypothetical protein